MSESNVHALPNAFIPAIEPDKDIVRMLEESLEKAKSGQLIGVAIVDVEKQPDGFTTHYYATQGGRHSLAAGVLSLMWQIGKACSED